MNQITSVKLIKGTGIGGGNYKYFSSKSDADSFFLGKVFHELDNYSFIRPNESTKNGYNVACIHVDLPYDKSLECDYISFKHDSYGRWFHAMVMDREYVNPNSSRLYFVVDYVATYWDLIELGDCFVERTHVNDDWEGNTIFGELSANKYFLPEPISVTSYPRPECDGGLSNMLFANVNKHFSEENSEYNYITSIPKDGKLEPKIYFQAGNATNGHIEHGNKSKIEEDLKTYPTFMHKFINTGDTVLQYVSSIYFAPKVVTDTTTTTTANSVEMTIPILPLNLWVKDIPKIKHAKTLSYFAYSIRTMGSFITFTAAESGNFPALSCKFTGSTDGKATVFLYDKKVQYFKECSTPNWVSVVNGNVVKQKESAVNEDVKAAASSGLENYGNARLALMSRGIIVTN